MLVILAGFCVVGVSFAERAMVSTGLDSESIASDRPDAAVWLEPPDEDRALALFQPETGTPVRGALLILADEGQSAASGLADGLVQPLAREGWAVMTIGLEPPPFAVQLARRRQQALAQGADSDDGESVMIDVMDSVDVEELASAYRNRIRKLLVEAIAKLDERGYEAIAMAGIGRGAGHATRAATDPQSDTVSALIWIAPAFDRVESEALPELLAEAGALAVLELHSARQGLQSPASGVRSPMQREAAFRRADVAGYSRQPVAMAAPPEAREAPALANRISAWLGSERQ